MRTGCNERYDKAPSSQSGTQRALGAAILAAVALLPIDCGSSTAPSATRFEIVGVTVGLKVGEQRALTAMLTDQGGTRPVQATWAATGNAVQLAPSGSVVGAMVGTARIQAVFESYNAAADVQVVNDYSGMWTGEYRIDQCVRLTGDGSSYCRFAQGQVLPVDFALMQNGSQVSGLGRFYSTGGRLVTSGPFTGISADSWQLQLTGTITSIDPLGTEKTTIDDWQTAVSTDGQMTGHFVRHMQFSNAFGPQTSREDCSLSKMSRSPSSKSVTPTGRSSKFLFIRSFSVGPSTL